MLRKYTREFLRTAKEGLLFKVADLPTSEKEIEQSLFFSRMAKCMFWRIIQEILASQGRKQNNTKETIGTPSSFCQQFLFTFFFSAFVCWSLYIQCGLYFRFTFLLLKSLLSLHFSLEVSTFFFLLKLLLAQKTCQKRATKLNSFFETLANKKVWHRMPLLINSHFDPSRPSTASRTKLCASLCKRKPSCVKTLFREYITVLLLIPLLWLLKIKFDKNACIIVHSGFHVQYIRCFETNARTSKSPRAFFSKRENMATRPPSFMESHFWSFQPLNPLINRISLLKSWFSIVISLVSSFTSQPSYRNLLRDWAWELAADFRKDHWEFWDIWSHERRLTKHV